MQVAEDLLQRTLPGQDVPEKRVRRAWRSLPEKPWRFRRSNGDTWAVYVVAGTRLAKTTTDSLCAAIDLGLRTVLILGDAEAIGAVAPHYPHAGFHIACQIAGCGQLVPPVVLPLPGPTMPVTAGSRIPRELLDEITAEGRCPRPLRTMVRNLRAAYGEKVLSDDEEYRLLEGFAARLFTLMGFKRAGVPDMLRKLESVGYGGRRDHFFHSFQNYFFGLLAVALLPDRFTLCQQVARLNFAVDPLHVWFLTALWHDAGYGIARFDTVVDEVLSAGGEETAEFARARFLRSSIVTEGRSVIASLMTRLLKPEKGKTQWLEPVRPRRRSSQQKQLEEAIDHDVLQRSHGAASALRLYAEYIPLIRRMAPDNELVLRQMVYLSCSSMPFHDCSFREAVRQHTGECRISTESMPFASLLAFVDSIQDDRRDLTGARDRSLFLERLRVNPPAEVTAAVNPRGLPDDGVLGKVVEARDVLASLVQQPRGLYFLYPAWMVA